MTTVDDKTLDLIQKLHNLATNKGATEAEAANALARMQALLFKHNISIEDVKLSPEERKSTLRDETASIEAMMRSRVGARRIRRNALQWAVTLAGDVARYNFCRIMVSTDYSIVYFVGTPENIAAVREIWQYACEQVMDLSEEGFKTYRNMDGRTDHRLWKRNFSNGCAWRLGERLREEWQKLQQQNVSSRALIVVNDGALEEYINQRASKVTSRVMGKNQDGIAEGYIAGNRVNLGPRAKELAEERGG